MGPTAGLAVQDEKTLLPLPGFEPCIVQRAPRRGFRPVSLNLRKRMHVLSVCLSVCVCVCVWGGVGDVLRSERKCSFTDHHKALRNRAGEVRGVWGAV
jgi:hypothetical protein